MAKATAIRSSTTTTRTIGKGAPIGDLQAFRVLAQKLKSDPDRLKELVMKAGITTPTGQLKKGYRQK